MLDCGVELTVLTPTYNRAKLLERLYESLCRQTCMAFQWLIIDDGSTDETQQLIKNFVEQNEIAIDYKIKKNGGKHTALNYSHPFIKGKYVVIVDSDDYLTYDAVDKILTKWKMYATDQTIAGITFQRGNPKNNKPYDTNIAGEYISTFAEETNKGMHGDHCETVRADLFKNFMFPEYDDERFVAEGAMWYSITRGYKVVYSDEIVYLAEYLEDGLTKSGRLLHIKNPKGCMWHASVFLNRDFCLKIRIKNALLLNCYGRFIGMTKAEVLSQELCDKNIIRLVWIPSFLLYNFWKKKYIT